MIDILYASFKLKNKCSSSPKSLEGFHTVSFEETFERNIENLSFC